MEKYLLVLEVIIKGVIRYFVCEMSEEDSEPATRKKMLTALANLLIKENGLEIKDSDMNRYISDVSKKYKNHIAIYNKDFNTSLFKDKDFKNVKNENFIRIMPTRKKPRTTEVIDRRIKSSQGTFYGSPAMMQKYNTKIQALKPYQLFIAKDEVGYYVITEAVTGCSLARSKTKSGLEEILAQITVEQLEKIRKKVVKLILHGENYNTFIPLPKINMELEEEIEKETEIIEEEKGDNNMMNLTKKEIVEMIAAAYGRYDAIVEMDEKYRAKNKLGGYISLDLLDIKQEVKGYDTFCKEDGKTEKQLLRRTKEELVEIYEAVNSVGDAMQNLHEKIKREIPAEEKPVVENDSITILEEALKKDKETFKVKQCENENEFEITGFLKDGLRAYIIMCDFEPSKKHFKATKVYRCSSNGELSDGEPIRPAFEKRFKELLGFDVTAQTKEKVENTNTKPPQKEEVSVVMEQEPQKTLADKLNERLEKYIPSKEVIVEFEGRKHTVKNLEFSQGGNGAITYLEFKYKSKNHCCQLLKSSDENSIEVFFGSHEFSRLRVNVGKKVNELIFPTEETPEEVPAETKEVSPTPKNNTINELAEKSKEANKTLENPLYQEHIEKTFGEGAVAYVSYDCSLLNVSINKDNVKTYLLNYYLSDGKVVPMYCYEVSKTNILIPKADCIANPLHEQVLKIFDRSLENNQSEATLKKLESDLNCMVELGWFKSKSDKAKNGFSFTIYNADHENWGYMNMALVDNPRVGFKIKFILKDNGLIEVVRGEKKLGDISSSFTKAEKKKFEQETINKRIEKLNAMNTPPVENIVSSQDILDTQAKEINKKLNIESNLGVFKIPVMGDECLNLKFTKVSSGTNRLHLEFEMKNDNLGVNNHCIREIEYKNNMIQLTDDRTKDRAFVIEIIKYLNNLISKPKQKENNVQIVCESAPTLTNNPPNDIIKSRKKTVKDKGDNKMNKELIGREEIMRAIENEIVNPQDQFLVASVYFGIASIGSAGKGFASMTSLKVKDVDLEKNIIHIDGKDLEIPACMRRIVEGAIKQDVYFRKMRENDASFNTPEFNLNMASEYVFKSKMAVQTDNGLKPLTEWTIKKRFRNAVEGTSLELFNASMLKKAGACDLLTTAKGKGIDLSTGDKINNFLVENNFSFSRKDIVAFTKMFKS